jgi:hypothetical protein
MKETPRRTPEPKARIRQMFSLDQRSFKRRMEEPSIVASSAEPDQRAKKIII